MSSPLAVPTPDLACIGMRFSGESLQSACERTVDIENTLLDVMEIFPDDTRLASVFLSWIKVHGNYVIVEKLAKFAAKRAENTGDEWSGAPWLSLTAAWAVECGFHKWKKLIKEMPETVYLYPKAASEGAIQLKGAIPWLEPLGFRIPQNSLRIREDDVAPPEKLVQHNLQYRNRYLFGASWRADIITAIQTGVTSPMEIVRAVGCSYEPAYRVSHEYGMIAHVTG